MKRFLVAIPTDDGGVELHPMKAWLRDNPSELPPGSDPTADNSHQLRAALKKAGWIVRDGDTEVRLVRPADAGSFERIVDVLGDDENATIGLSSQDSEQSFGLEHQLRDFLAQNLHRIPIAGRSLKVYVDQTGRDGIEYPTDVGPIDILATDDNGAFIVFELKRARVADQAVGQLARYMGWVKHTIGRGRSVSGVVVAKRIDTKLKYAASVVPGVTLLEYAVEFHLHEANDLPLVGQAAHGFVNNAN
jgi:endonuclease